MLSALYFFDNTGIFSAALISCTVHEMGHIAAIRLLGGRIEEIRLTLAGAAIRRGGDAFSYFEELLAALAGPASGFAFSAACAYLYRLNGSGRVSGLAGTSLILSVFNLLPAPPLDGGRVLYMLTAQLFGIRAAETTVFISGLLVIAPMLAAGALLIAYTGTNFTLLAAAVWLLAASIKTASL
jgi:stage IV sporulation protein FB